MRRGWLLAGIVTSTLLVATAEATTPGYIHEFYDPYYDLADDPVTCRDHGILNLIGFKLHHAWTGNCPGDFDSVITNRFWVSSEYLLWWTRAPVSNYPLVTTGPAIFPAGFLGDPNTRVLYGGSSLDNPSYSGGRFAVGGWLTDGCRPIGFELGGFFLGQQTSGPTFDSSQYPVLARPFFNNNLGIQYSEVLNFPGLISGQVTDPFQQSLWGISPTIVQNLCASAGCDCSPTQFLLQALVGLRYVDAQQTLGIIESGVVLNQPQFPDLAGSRFVIRDDFTTRNQFYGPNFGVFNEVRRGRFFANWRGQFAFGATHQRVSINGGQVITRPNGQVNTYTGGLLALPSNIGTEDRDRFAILPEIGLNVGATLFGSLRLYVGYSFLYWSNFAWPGQQIDPRLDVRQIPNFDANAPASAQVVPRNPFARSDFWAQGLNLGLQYAW